jgi:GT2 family glycosyltransferase/glycosyltransferase involved in cell wall biosynthesis
MVNIILPTIRFTPLVKEIMTHLFITSQAYDDIHVTIADGQINEEKRSWVFRAAESLLKARRLTYIGLQDPAERLYRAAQIDAEWVLLLSDDDAPTVNYVRALCDAARRVTPQTTAVLPRTFVCYSPAQFYHCRFQPLQDQSQRGRLLSLFKQGQNGLWTFGVMRRQLFKDWLEFVRRKPAWPTYSDQVFVGYVAMKGLVALTEEECVYLKDESDWHDLRRAFLKDAGGYPRKDLALAHEIFLVADLFRFLRANGLEDAALPALTYRAKDLLKGGLAYYPIRLKVLAVGDGRYSQMVCAQMKRLLAQAMSLPDDDVTSHLRLLQEIELVADQLASVANDSQSFSTETVGDAEEPMVQHVLRQREALSIRQPQTVRQLRVLLVVHGFPPKSAAGTELYTLALARELLRRGHAVRVLYPLFGGTRPEGSVSESQYENIPVSELHVASAKTFEELFHHPAAAKAFRSYLMQHPVDVVHFQHVIGLSASVLSACKQLGVPSVMTLHDAWFLCEQWHYMLPDGNFCTGPDTVDKCVRCMLSRHPGSPIQRQIPMVYYQLALRRETLRAAIQQVDALIVLTEFQRRDLEQHGFVHPKTLVAPIGLEWSPPLDRVPRDGPMRVLYLGHIARRKGLDVLLRAFSRLPKSKARLDIYGEVVDWKYFEQTMRLASSMEGINYHGGYTKGDLPRILSHCDIAVVPSRAEFYPTTVRECLAAQVPVIASCVGGVPELIEHGRTGLLFRSGDDADLADKLNLFIADAGQVERFRSAIRPVRTMAQDVDEIERLYGELLFRNRWGVQRSDNVPAGDGQAHVSSLGEGASARYVCSIIIPVSNNLELTKQCLTALASSTTAVDYEVILVDNGSMDGTAAFLQTLQGDVRIIRNDENRGFAKACNQGAKEARGKYLVFLNNDTIPQSNWLGPLVQEVEEHPEVGVVGSKLLYPDGTIQHAGVVFSRDGAPYHIYRRVPADSPAVSKRREFQAVTAACLLIRRDLFEAVGGFDEAFVNGFEDVDLCLKVRKQGFQVIYQPRSVLYHFESQTPGCKTHDVVNSRLLRERWNNFLWMEDADLHYYMDGFKLVGDSYDAKMATKAVPLTDVRDRASWAHVAAVQAAALKKDWEAVRRELQLVDEWPNDRLVLSWGANVAERLKEPKYQVRFLTRAVEVGGTTNERISLARLLLEQGDVVGAEQQLRAALRSETDHAEGLLLHGVLCMQREQYGEAESSFVRALKAGADRRKCLMGMGMAAMGRSYPQGAWEKFCEVLVDQPDDAEAIHWLLRAGTAQNRWEELSRYLALYVKRNPGDLAVRFALAGVWLRADHVEEAKRELETIRALNPQFDGLAELEQAIARKEAMQTVSVTEE